MVAWREFKDRLKPLVAWMKRSREVEHREIMWASRLKDLLESFKKGTVTQSINKELMASNMSGVKQLQILQSSNVDVPINTQYQDFLESLKIN